MNRMLHIAATTQIRLDTAGRAYYRRKLADGKTRMEAMRCLKRRISDAVYRQLVADARTAATRVGTGPGGHCGAYSRIQRGRPAPAHRHFGSATSRTRETDATTARSRPGRPQRQAPSSGPLDNRGEPVCSGRYAAASVPLCWEPARKPNLMRALRHMRQWRDAGVPLGCPTRDGRRRELLSMLRCRPRESGSGFDALAFDGAVDRRAADAEELGDFKGAVLATVY